jgi:hypothetical protein
MGNQSINSGRADYQRGASANAHNYLNEIIHNEHNRLLQEAQEHSDELVNQHSLNRSHDNIRRRIKNINATSIDENSL